MVGMGVPGAGGSSALANSCLPNGGRPATRNFTSSVMRSSTVATSPAFVARIHVATRSRICCSSLFMRRRLLRVRGLFRRTGGGAVGDGGESHRPLRPRRKHHVATHATAAGTAAELLAQLGLPLLVLRDGVHLVGREDAAFGV